MVLIHLSDHNKDKFKELYDYLNKNYKSSGNINKTSEVIDGKKNFVLWSFDNSRVLLILTLNYLGEVFGIPGIELNQLNIKKDDTVYLKLHSTKSSSISRMNDMLQNNNYFLSKVRSIQNISDQKTQMEIDLTLKEMK